MDLVHATTWTGRRFVVILIIDIFCREVLAVVTDMSIGGSRVA